MPTLETGRLVIREFVADDLPALGRLLDGEAETRARWLRWTLLSYEELAELRQPPYGDRAMVSRESGQLVGACGLAPLLAPFGQIPGLGDGGDGRYWPEVGLYWAVLPEHQRRGYATEAGRALAQYAFEHLRLRRILATTTLDNAASMAVMRKLGMRVECNPLPEPAWLQVVGVLEQQASG